MEQHAEHKHLDISASLNNLAGRYRVRGGKYAEAKRLYEPALSICEQRWGPEHPNTLIVQENYASLLQETGQDGKAASLETNQQWP